MRFLSLKLSVDAHCKLVTLALMLAVCVPAFFLGAQTPPPAPPAARPSPTPEQLAIQAASEKDHQRVMDELGIKELRHGADSDPKSPYAAQLRRVESRCLPEDSRSTHSEQRQAGNDRQSLVEPTQAGDRGAFRPRDLWPHAGESAQGQLGGREHGA